MANISRKWFYPFWKWKYDTKIKYNMLYSNIENRNTFIYYMLNVTDIVVEFDYCRKE